ncbi:MAG TPA: ATP synthase F1 subunit gamma, partial [Gemmatimonadales bacterium]|nr:ATP synthase F1 subunit gamma [Gemmatimonadales bacterium]
MAKPRELRRRIRSVQNTRKITKTMELVSTSKLKRAQDRVVGARPYAQALAEVIGELYSPELAERFPLLRQPTHDARRTALVLITSNRGLCGAFNSNLIREARRCLDEMERQDAHTELHLVGKKGISYFKFTRRNVASQRVDIGDKPTLQHAQDLAQPLMERFAKGDLDAVDVVFAKFNSAVSTPPTTLRVLPVMPPERRRSDGQDAKAAVNYILQPSAEGILHELLPLYVINQVYRAL